MPQITFLLPDGRALPYEAEDAPTVMHVAIRHDLPGLPAECGGQLACATCMGDVAEEWRGRVPEAGPDEHDMIEDRIGHVPPGWRLCCQIALSPALDGLVVRVPESQG